MGELDVLVPDIPCHGAKAHEIVAHYGLAFTAGEEVLPIIHTLENFTILNAKLLQLATKF